MNQYVLILIWTLILGIYYEFNYMTYAISNNDIKYKKASILFCIMLVFPLILSAAFRTDFGDQGYKISYRIFSDSFSSLISSIESGVKGPGYQVIQYFGTLLLGNNAEIFFFVIASLQMYSLVRLYRKYSSDVWIAMFIFVASTDYLSWMQNGIRQFIAVTLIILFSDWIFEKKYLRICIIIIIASTIHTSALLMIPIVFIVQGEAFNKKTVLAIIATILALAMLGRLVPALDLMLADTEYNNAITDWQTSGNDGVNFFRVLVYSVPTLLSLLGIKRIRQSGNYVINVTCNMGVMSTLLYIMGMFTSGIYVGRLPIYCSLYSNGILLPWLIRRLFTKESSRLVVIFMVIAYIAYYYYQTHFIWGII